VIGLVGGMLVDAGEARAYHGESDRISLETAYSLRRRQWRVGLFDVAYGVHDKLTISTGTMIWVGGALALRAPAPNITLKSAFWEHGRYALSATTGFTFIPGTLDGSDVRVFLVPFKLAGSVRVHPRVTLSTELSYTLSKFAYIEPPADQSVAGAAAINGFHQSIALQWNASRVTALVLTGRFMWKVWGPYVSGSVGLGDGATGSLDGTYTVADLAHAWNVSLAAAFSWRIVNLRVGAGYGSFFLHTPDFVVPGKYPVPEIDFYVRF